MVGCSAVLMWRLKDYNRLRPTKVIDHYGPLDHSVFNFIFRELSGASKFSFLSHSAVLQRDLATGPVCKSVRQTLVIIIIIIQHLYSAIMSYADTDTESKLMMVGSRDFHRRDQLSYAWGTSPVCAANKMGCEKPPRKERKFPTFVSQYLGSDGKHDLSYYWSLVGNRIRAFDWY